MENLSDRFEIVLKYLKTLGISARKFSTSVGISEQFVSDIKHGRSAFRLPTAMMIEEKFGIPAAWLLRGEGEWTPPPPEIPCDVIRGREIRILGYIPAGFPGAQVLEDMVIGTMIDADAPEGAYGLIVRGDCMDPNIREGDLAIFTPGNGARPGDLVITLDENGFSQLKRYGEKDGRGILKCDNPAYKDIDEGPETRVVGIVWKVNRAIYRRMGKA
jgi:transcriptional regulator with XRE-family HTH domain